MLGVQHKVFIVCVDILYIIMNGELESKLKKGTVEIEHIEDEQDKEVFSHDKRFKNLSDKVL
ncbi:unnamed protein product [marine sediment metagenome]|uniref:Uncharacterized protein n=1 Tax=marine sediment metagenome TaxID=412755 RepID=X1FY62_9ZZZZ